jgi:RNA polymerase primary sigma factor
MPPYLQELYRLPLLSPARERALFLKLHYYRFRFTTARRQIEPQVARHRELELLENLLRRIVETRNAIVRANLRLVVSVARKHLRPGLNLMELISDGNLTLLRAVETFDVHRGNRFSTYATFAMMKGFARSVPMMQAMRRIIPTASAAAADRLAEVPDACAADHQRAHDLEYLQHLLGILTDRERAVLLAHYGVGNAGSAPSTYEQLGHRMGLSRQRVRQIEQTALAKLRARVHSAASL